MSRNSYGFLKCLLGSLLYRRVKELVVHTETSEFCFIHLFLSFEHDLLECTFGHKSTGFTIDILKIVIINTHCFLHVECSHALDTELMKCIRF